MFLTLTKSRKEDSVRAAAAAELGVTGTKARVVCGMPPRISGDMKEARTVPSWCRLDGARVVIPDSYFAGSGRRERSKAGVCVFAVSAL